MIAFPNAKINIGLQVLRKRPDGYHDLSTVFCPIALQDGLEIVPSAEPTRITQSGLAIDAQQEDNICFKAWQLLKRDLPELPNVRIHLHKTIPSGAGLGGGSADGAFTLQLLNRKFRLGLNDERLLNYALELGSDCPFFILNKPAFATGRGEQLEPLALDLTKYRIVIVNPGIHVNTGWAFGQLQPKASDVDLRAAVQLPVEQWKNLVRNDFEAPVSRTHPPIAEIREALYAQGALYAAMSGSGSTVFGLFPAGADPVLNFPASYFVRQI